MSRDLAEKASSILATGEVNDTGLKSLSTVQTLESGTSGREPLFFASVVLEHNPVQARSCICRQEQEKVQRQTLSKQYSGSTRGLGIFLPSRHVGPYTVYARRHTGAQALVQIPVREALRDESEPSDCQEIR